MHVGHRSRDIRPPWSDHDGTVAASRNPGGVSGGVWKTTNSGRRWRPVGDELANLAVNTLAMDPDSPKTLYAGTGEGYFREKVRGTGLPLRGAGIFKSEDGGASWAQLAKTRKKAFLWVNDIVISVHDSARLYAATRKGVFRSKNGGASWRRILRARENGGCLQLAVRPDQPGDSILASCGTLEQARIYRKEVAEKAGGWEVVLEEPGMGRTSLAIAPSDSAIVYAMSASNVPGPGGNFEQALHAVFRSDDGGAAGSWEARVRNSDPDEINTLLLSNPVIALLEECGFSGANRNLAMGWYVNTLAVDPRDPERVWAGGVDLFRTDDGGRSWDVVTYWWTNRSSSNFVHADQQALVFHPKKMNTLFSLNDGGLFRTQNAGAPTGQGLQGLCNPGSSSVHWRPLNSHYGVTQFYHGTPFPGGRQYMAGAQDNGTVMGLDGLGSNNWFPIAGGDGGYSAVDPTDTDVIYATFQNGEIIKSTDGGREFDDAVNGITDLNVDDDDDFTARVPNFLFISPLVMDPNDPQTLWSGGRRLWRTRSGAQRWSSASAPLRGSGKASAIAVAAGDSDRVLVGAHDGRVYRTDGATTTGAASEWRAAMPRSGFVTWVAFDPNDLETVYATYGGFTGRHVWRSTDGGASWRSIDGSGATRLPKIPVHSLVVDPGDGERLYAGTDLGVFVSLNGGGDWAVENTGFAAVVTESLSIAPDSGPEPYLFAFTHGRGAWRVRLRD